MAFHKITYNAKHRFATLHNFGCTFRCGVCSYKLRGGSEATPGLAYPRPQRFLSVAEMKETLLGLTIDRVSFMGGEPTTATDLPEMLDFAKNELGLRTFLGHTNGSRLPLENLDGANVGLKAWDEAVHLAYTGRPKKPIFDNFAAAVRSGMEIKANVVLVPGLVEIDQIEQIVAWIAGLNAEIPFHIMGYIPVPGQPYPRPTAEAMAEATDRCRHYLKNVAVSHLTTDEALDLTARDERFAVKRVA